MSMVKALRYDKVSWHAQKMKWQELDPSKSICLKVNEHDIIPIPPFAITEG